MSPPSSSPDSDFDPPMLSRASKDMLARVRCMVPPMLEKFHKGQLGRIAVIGGSKDYTGAPFFSAMASARLGADMSHVICTPSAGAIIKTYSPNLMVHLLMRESTDTSTSNSSSSASESDPENSPDTIAKPIIEMLPRLHALVIGPGLGRDVLMHAICARVLSAARSQKLPVVLDADALGLVKTHTDTIRGWKEVVLTPNVVEFKRLADALGVDVSGSDNGGEACARVSRALDGVLVLQKGQVDVLSNGSSTWICDLEGGRKRSGGQGDTLTGSIGTLLCWRRAYLEKLWDVEGDFDEAELMMLAAWGGAAITRECSRLAFKAKGRALQASDVGEMVPRSFEALIGEKKESML